MSGVTRLGLGLALITKQNTSGQYRIGSVSVGATNGTTAWSQVVASLTAESLVTVTHAVISGGGTFGFSVLDYVEVGIGGAGSETSIATVPLYNAATGGGNTTIAQGYLVVPSRISAGQRVAVRLTTGISTATDTVTIYLFGVPYANIEGA